MKIKNIALVLSALSLLAASCNSKTTQTTPLPEPAMQVVDADGGNETAETAMREKAAHTETLGKANSSNQAEPGPSATPTPQTGKYEDYSPDAVAQAQKAGSKVVLFFHADWCPFCVEADKQFKAKLDQIPPGVTIFKTPYDTETALKQKYGVTYQHTFVQIDAKGNMVTKWNGGDIANLKKYIK